MDPDPFALNADGSAADPLAFQQALRAETAKMANLEADPELKEVLLGSDIPAMQALLQQAFNVRVQTRPRALGHLRRHARCAYRRAAVLQAKRMEHCRGVIYR